MRQIAIAIAVSGLTLVACSKKAEPTTDGHAATKVEHETASLDSEDCAPAALRSSALSSGQTVLAGVTMEASTPIADLMDDPASYAEKTVQIEGRIVEVCAKAGCFVSLDDGDGHQVNLKVKDGEVDFRELAVAGQYAVGEGTFMKRGPHGSQVFLTGARVGTLVCR